MNEGLFGNQGNMDNIKTTALDWYTATSRVPQGSVMDPVMFMIYVYKLNDGRYKQLHEIF